MSWEVRQTRLFARTYKKLHDNIAVEVDKAVEAIAHNPSLGDQKKGDLAHLWVYRLRIKGSLYLLGYSREDAVRLIYLESVGPHENFYRDLKH